MGRRDRTKPVVRVEDFTALDAEIAAYIAQGDAAPRTHSQYEIRWASWERHCEREGVDPWDAPAEAFESLWLMRCEDGRPASFDYIQGIASAVGHHYRERGLRPAHKLPENNGRWRDLRRAKKKQARIEDDDGEGASAVPLMRSEVTTLLSAPLPWTPAQLARRAAMLLWLEGLRAPTLARLERDDVRRADGGAMVAGTFVPCDHEERIRGVPWDCAACAVLDMAAQRGQGRLIDASTAHLLRNGTSSLRRRFPHLAPAGTQHGPRPGLTPWQLAGLRRGMVLWSCSGESCASRLGLRSLRARAWVALAWTCGLRMAGDTSRLVRGAARPDTGGRGWVVTLGMTKDDPFASKGEVRAFAWDDAVSEMSVAALLAEYLCVRDAMTATSNLLIVANFDTFGTGRRRKEESVSVLARRDLALLSGLAGVDPVYTSYSTRKGYTAQAVEDGWPLEDIQAGLRHLHLTTTLVHYVPNRQGREAVERLVQNLDTTEESL